MTETTNDKRRRTKKWATMLPHALYSTKNYTQISKGETKTEPNLLADDKLTPPGHQKDTRHDGLMVSVGQKRLFEAGQPAPKNSGGKQIFKQRY